MKGVWWGLSIVVEWGSGSDCPSGVRREKRYSVRLLSWSGLTLVPFIWFMGFSQNHGKRVGNWVGRVS